MFLSTVKRLKLQKKLFTDLANTWSRFVGQIQAKSYQANIDPLTRQWNCIFAWYPVFEQVILVLPPISIQGTVKMDLQQKKKYQLSVNLSTLRVKDSLWPVVHDNDIVIQNLIHGLKN